MSQYRTSDDRSRTLRALSSLPLGRSLLLNGFLLVVVASFVFAGVQVSAHSVLGGQRLTAALFSMGSLLTAFMLLRRFLILLRLAFSVFVDHEDLVIDTRRAAQIRIARREAHVKQCLKVPWLAAGTFSLKVAAIGAKEGPAIVWVPLDLFEAATAIPPASTDMSTEVNLPPSPARSSSVLPPTDEDKPSWRASPILWLATFVIGTWICASVIVDHLRSRPDPSWPVVNGTVVSRSTVKTGYFTTRGQLRIRIEPDGPEVMAILSLDSLRDIPQRVTFQFSGDPSREIVLQEESSPLTVLVIVGIATLGALLFLLFEVRAVRDRP